jgi:redox-sensitive bicupin YhaK (pirin superfamily)
MLTIRKSQDRGLADHGWLKSRHSFSFADYYDPNHMSFRTLRVINEDRIAGGTGFDTHAHRDMEIISYVMKGSLEHKDSMGNATVIVPDDVQVMSAGSGVKHSEYNHSKTEEGHFLQIWITPDKQGLTPSYGQKSFKEAFVSHNFVLVASRDGRQGSLLIHQDADLYIGRLKSADTIKVTIKIGRHVWIQMIQGEIQVNGVTLVSGDGLAVSEETSLHITAAKSSEFLLFDLQ